MKLVLFTAATLGLTSGALAADLTYEPAPAPAAVSQTFDWTGFYAGVHAGGGWGDYTATYRGTLQFKDSGGGALGGGQIGYNYQINQFVIGVQTDIAYAGIEASATIASGLPVEGKTNWLGSTTLRAGYAADTWLFYGKGGLAYANTEATVRSVTQSSWSTGWTLGAGIEKAFTKHVTGFLEYDYFDVGSVDVDTIAGPASISPTFNIVKAGINYKF